MDKMHEIAGDGALMPRFDDGMVNIAELIRVMAGSIANEIMDAQADEVCESGKQLNGYRERKLVTSVGTINLKIPKLRARAHPREHRGRVRGQDHRARGGRQPDSRQEGGVACARMTAF